MARTSQQQHQPDDWMRPRDFQSLAVLAAGALALIASYWWAHGGHRGELIDVDRAEPLEAHFQVDVNQADWPELMQLPGIGPTLARRLVNERRQHGRFGSVDDLVRVRGIGQRTVQRIRPYVSPIAGDRELAGR